MSRRSGLLVATVAGIIVLAVILVVLRHGSRPAIHRQDIRANVLPPCSASRMFAAAEAKEHFSASSPGYNNTIRPGASDPVCHGTWAIVSVSRPNVGTTDGITLFRAQDGAWIEVADVGGVHADCVLEAAGVPASVARVLWPRNSSLGASYCQH